MIRGLHGLFYSTEAEAMRAFIKDKLQLEFTDVGQGWLIFDVPEGDVGVHPTEDEAMSGKHDVSFYCDDIHGTVAGMKERGVEFEGAVEDHGYGLVTHFTMPGKVRVQLFEPRYKTFAKPAAAKKKKKPAPKAKPKKKAKPAKKKKR